MSFGYEVHRVFVKRLAERVAFVTNLLETQEFDFSVPEEYTFRRDKLPWPSRTEEAEAFLMALPHEYHDENCLHAFLINRIGEPGRGLAETERFLPDVVLHPFYPFQFSLPNRFFTILQ